MRVLREKDADRIFFEDLRTHEARLKAELKQLDDHHAELQEMVKRFMTYVTGSVIVTEAGGR